MMKKLTIAGCIIGGLPETQDCIDFCHKHNIVPKIKIVTCDELDDLYKVMEGKNDSIIRLVNTYNALKNRFTMCQHYWKSYDEIEEYQ